MFIQFVIPESIVSVNGPQSAASKFQEFCRLNEIWHIRVAPYQPSSNGLAKRAVQVFNSDFEKQRRQQFDHDKHYKCDSSVGESVF